AARRPQLADIFCAFKNSRAFLSRRFGHTHCDRLAIEVVDAKLAVVLNASRYGLPSVIVEFRRAHARLSDFGLAARSRTIASRMCAARSLFVISGTSSMPCAVTIATRLRSESKPI